MKTTDLEKTASSLAERYKPQPKKLSYEPEVPLRVLKKGMIISGAGTVLFGALLLYAMFPDTVESIIEYFTQKPF